MHEWVQFKGHYQNYYKRIGRLRLGAMGQAVWSGQGDFNNYTASILRAPAFQPTPESKTYFLDAFRAYKYGALGHQIVFTPFNNFDIRLEAYVFQPFEELLQSDANLVSMGPSLDRRYTIAMATAVYHTPVGPVSFGANYYSEAPEVSQVDDFPVSFLFHFGYIIFNKRALE